MSSGSGVNIIVKGVDQISATISKIEQRLGGLNKAVGSVSKNFGLLRATIQGVAQGFGQAIFFQLQRSLASIARIIPDLISRGREWLGTVDQVADVTGLAADKASILAAQAQQLEVPIDALGRLFAMFTKNIRPNAELLEGLGVAVKDASGNTRDAASIFYDLQRVISSSNNGVDRATILAKLFGRNWKEAADLLTAPPALLDAIAQHALATGQVVTAQQMQMRQDFERTQIALQGTLSGLGTSLFTSLAPALTGLINSIRAAIEANMAQIVGFVSKVAGFVVGVVSGLFGLNLQLANFAAGAPPAIGGADDLGDALDNLGTKADGASGRVDGLNARIKAIDNQMRALDRREQARDAGRQRAELVQAIRDARRGADATDAYTASLDRQIAAIDRQLAAMDKRDRQEENAKARAEIVGEISDLQAQLEDMRSTAVFTAGMTALEAELARQRQAADIADQQQRIKDAQGRLTDHDKQVAKDRRRDELQAARDRLEDRKREHQQEIDQRQTLNDAIERLREFDHDQAVQHHRQNLDDQRRHYQDQITALRGAAKDAKPLLDQLWQPDLTKREGPLAGFAASVKTELDKALLDGQSFARQMREFLFGNPGGPVVNASTGFVTGQQQGSQGLMGKIDGLVDGMKDLWTKWSPTLTKLGELTDALIKWLGPEGFATLFVLWKVGGPIATIIGSLAGLFRPGVGLPTPTPTPGGVVTPTIGAGIFVEKKVLFDQPSAIDPNRTIGDILGSVHEKLNAQGNPWAPGSPAYRLLDDALGEAQRNADNAETTATNTAATSAAVSTVRDNTTTLWAIREHALRVAAATEATRTKLTAGITSTIAGNVPVVNASTGFRTDIVGNVPVVNASTGFRTDIGAMPPVSVTGSVPVVNAATGFRTDIGAMPSVTIGGTPTVNAATGFTVKVGGAPDVTIAGTPTVNAATGFTTKITGTPPVAIAGTPTVNAATGFTVTARVPGTVDVLNPALGKLHFTGTGNLSTSTATGTPGGGCFVYGTLVSTPNGQRKIEEIETGDVVTAVDVTTMQRSSKKVLAVHRHPANQEPRRSFTLADGREFEATVSHPLYDAGSKTFRPASEFRAGMTMHDAFTGEDVEITSALSAGDAPWDVCDISVDVHHDYLINGGLLVHNADTKGGVTGIPTDFGILGPSSASREAMAVMSSPRSASGGSGSYGGVAGAMQMGDTVIPITLQLDSEVFARLTTRYQYRKGGRSTTTRPG